jgi:hypothetical protein
MQKYIVYLLPEDKKEQRNQFHTEVETMKDALKKVQETAPFKHRVLGVRAHNGIDFTNNLYL